MSQLPTTTGTRVLLWAVVCPVAFFAAAVTFTTMHPAKLSILILLFYLWQVWTNQMLAVGKCPDVTILVGVGDVILTVAVVGAVQPDDAAAAAAQGNGSGKAWLYPSRQQELPE
jgi:hypothetical protein